MAAASNSDEIRDLWRRMEDPERELVLDAMAILRAGGDPSDLITAKLGPELAAPFIANLKKARGQTR